MTTLRLRLPLPDLALHAEPRISFTAAITTHGSRLDSRTTHGQPLQLPAAPLVSTRKLSSVCHQTPVQIHPQLMPEAHQNSRTEGLAAHTPHISSARYLIARLYDNRCPGSTANSFTTWLEFLAAASHLGLGTRVEHKLINSLREPKPNTVHHTAACRTSMFMYVHV
jgi:hypothetical protein